MTGHLSQYSGVSACRLPPPQGPGFLGGPERGRYQGGSHSIYCQIRVAGIHFVSYKGGGHTIYYHIRVADTLI